MEIKEIAYLGASEDGESLILGLMDPSGKEHEFTLHYSKMSRLLTAILTAGQVAAKNRTSVTPLGSVMPELHNLMILKAAQALKLPDGHVAAKLDVEDVPIEIRLTEEQAKQLAHGLNQAIQTSTPAGSSIAH